MRNKLKYILSLLFLFTYAISQAQNDDGYMIPKVDIEKSTDSIIAQLKNKQVDTIIAYYTFCGNCTAGLFLNHVSYLTSLLPGRRKIYYSYSSPFEDSYIIWVKSHKSYVRKVDDFAVYDSLESGNTAIFTYSYQKMNNLLRDSFLIESVQIDSLGHEKRIIRPCGTYEGGGSFAVIYLNNLKVHVEMDKCYIDQSVKDPFYIRNFTSPTHLLELMIEDEINRIKVDSWKTNQKLYYTRREFMKWKRLHEKKLTK